MSRKKRREQAPVLLRPIRNNIPIAPPCTDPPTAPVYVADNAPANHSWGTWEAVFRCTKCREYMSPAQINFRNGVCVHCGHAANGTVCDYDKGKMRYLRKHLFGVLKRNVGFEVQWSNGETNYRELTN